MFNIHNVYYCTSLHNRLKPTENPDDDIKENEYELPSQRPPVRETTPLIPVEADSSTTQTAQPLEKLTFAPDQGSSTVTPLSLPHPKIEVDSFYTTIVTNTSSSSGKIPLPPSTEKVAYHKVKRYKSELVCIGTCNQYFFLADLRDNIWSHSVCLLERGKTKSFAMMMVHAGSS